MSDNKIKHAKALNDYRIELFGPDHEGEAPTGYRAFDEDGNLAFVVTDPRAVTVDGKNTTVLSPDELAELDKA